MEHHPPPADLPQRLETFAQLVEAAPFNLVSRRARAELRTRHVPESLAFAELLPPDGRFLDLGSGGGLPGMVLALHGPAREVHLLDATAKKTAFLVRAASVLGVDVQVHTIRAEDAAQGAMPGSFDVVTARALAPLDRLVAWAAPFLAADGRLAAIKGERWASEVEAAGPAIRAAGLRILDTPASDPWLAPGPDRPLAPRVVMLGRA